MFKVSGFNQWCLVGLVFKGLTFDADGNLLSLNRHSWISIQPPQTANHWLERRAQPVTKTTRIDFSLTFPVFFPCKKWLHMFCFGKMVDYHLNNTFSFERKQWYSLEVQQLGSQLCGLFLSVGFDVFIQLPMMGSVWLQLILWNFFTLFFGGGKKRWFPIWQQLAAYVSNGLAGSTKPTQRTRGLEVSRYLHLWNFEKEVDQIPAAPNKKGRTSCCCWPGVELQE